MSYTIRDTPTLAEQTANAAIDFALGNLPTPGPEDEIPSLVVTLPGHVDNVTMTIGFSDKTTAPEGATKEDDQ